MWAALRRSRIVALLCRTIVELLVVLLVMHVWWNVLLARSGHATWLHFPQFAWRILTGDWGYSRSNSEPVLRAIAERIPASLELYLFTLALVLILTIAVRFLRTRKLDAPLTVAACVAGSVPVFILAFETQMIAVHNPALPTAGSGSNFFDFFKHAILPGSACALALAWDFLHAYDDEVARTPVAAVVRTMARQLPWFIGSLIVAEPIFAWPGLGRIFNNGIGEGDGTLISGVVIFFALVCIAGRFSAGLATGESLET